MLHKNRNHRHVSGLRSRLLIGSILLTGLASPALGQSIDPKREQPDDNRVDLATGQISLPGPSVSIGDPSQGGMVYSRAWRSGGWVDDGPDPDMIAIGGDMPNPPQEFDLYKSGFQEGFYGSTYPLASGNGNGGQIFKNGDGTYTHKAANGASTVFGTLFPNDFLYYPITKTTAAGIKTTYYFKPTTGYFDWSGTVTTFNIARLQSITNSLGFQIKYTYAGNTSTDPQSTADFTRATSVTMINNGVEYCDPSADACSGLTQNWPKLTFSSSQAGSNTVESVTDSMNRVTQFTINSSGQLVGITHPGSSTADFSIALDSNNRVASITNAGIASSYSWTPSVVGTVHKLTGVRSDALGTIRTTLANANLGVIETDIDALNHTTTYAYDGAGRESSVVLPEGNSEQYSYDGWGNITQATSIAKSGSGLANIVIQAGFDTNCTNTLTCNKPNWTKDALGNQTDYTYSSATGQLLTVTAPAATSGGVRPQVRYRYTPLNAWYKNASGTL
ncbi:MAG: RHS repeat domain-containing protein, partial [Novosphingobium sp.]